MRYVFYDLETTGLSEQYDQILQFAAIVTDDSFQEIERTDLRCRLSAHVLPNPIALAVTGVYPNDFLDPALPTSFEMVQAIRNFLLRHAPATWIGYNSIRFDENFLRQAFYQNLQPNIYETQFNGNNRLDVLQLMQACRVKAPDVLEWPSNDKNKISMKLELLAPANGFVDHHAHDALGDVEATLHLTRLIADRAPQLWSQSLRNRNKRDVIDLIKQFQPIELVNSYRGNVSRTAVCFCALAGNFAYFVDIENHDPQEFLHASEAELARLFEPGNKVLQKVAINKAPNVFAMDSAEQLIVERAHAVKTGRDFLTTIKRLAEQDLGSWEVDDSLPVEERIYAGFYSDADKSVLEQFQQVDWVTRANLIGQLQDRRLKQLGNRLLTFQGEQSDDPRQQQRAVEYLRDKWLNEEATDVRWATFRNVETQLEELRGNGMIDDDRIAELTDFYQSIREALDAGQLPGHRPD